MFKNERKVPQDSREILKRVDRILECEALRTSLFAVDINNVIVPQSSTSGRGGGDERTPLR